MHRASLFRERVRGNQLHYDGGGMLLPLKYVWKIEFPQWMYNKRKHHDILQMLELVIQFIKATAVVLVLAELTFLIMSLSL